MLYWQTGQTIPREAATMAQTETPKLDAGDRFPPMTIALVDGRSVTLPDDLSDVGRFIYN